MTKEEILQYIKSELDNNENAEIYLDVDDYKVIVEALEQEPSTADAKPILHAHWIEGQTDNPKIHNILCSNCLNGYPSKGHANSQYTQNRFKWCPSCGAKMEEEESK